MTRSLDGMVRISSSRLSRGILFCALITAPLLVGATSSRAVLGIAVLLLVGLTARVLTNPRETTLAWNRSVAWALGLALGAEILQLLPLPAAIVGWLSPRAYAVWALPTAAVPQTMRLSLDPASTLAECLKLLTLILAVLLASASFRTARHVRQLLRCIGVAGAAVAGVGIVQLFMGLDRPYGVFGGAAPLFSATFINPNHAAAFFGLCSLVSLGLAIEAPSRRWLDLACGGLCGACTLLTLSRGGIIAYTLAALAMLTVTLLRRIGATLPQRQYIGVVLGVSLAVALAASASYTRIVHEMFTLTHIGNDSRLALLRAAPEMLAAFPFTGVGRGAFGVAFDAFAPVNSTLRFTHIENAWLQLLVDFGPIMGLALIVLMLVVAKQAYRYGKNEPGALGALLALTFIALQNMFDFSVEQLSIALPVALIASTFTMQFNHLGKLRATRRLQPGMARVTLGALAAAIFLIAPTALVHGIPHDEADAEALLHADNARTGKVHSDAVDRIITANERRHPADYLFPLWHGEALLARHTRAHEALRDASHAMFLAPTRPEPHLLAFHAQRALGKPSQALDELAAAIAMRPLLAANMDEAFAWVARDPDRVDALGARLYTPGTDHAAQALVGRFPAMALRLLAASGEPLTAKSAMVSSEAHLRTNRFDAAYADLQTSKARGNAELLPLAISEATVLVAMGHRDRAIDVLHDAIRHTGQREALTPHLVAILLADDRVAEAQQAAQQLLETTGTREDEAHALLGATWEHTGNRGRALGEYERSRTLSPLNIKARLAIMQLREKGDDLRGAIAEGEDALAAGCARGAIAPQLARLRQRMRTAQEQAQWEWVQSAQ